VRLSPPLARADSVAELHLDHRDELLSAERAPVGAHGLESVERRLLVERQFQEIGEARRSLERRADRNQRVVAPLKDAGLTLDHGHARGDAASRARTGLNARVRSALRKWASSIANEANRPLKQMARRAGDERGEAPMGLPQPPGKGRPRRLWVRTT
jgi:hypothetical protein